MDGIAKIGLFILVIFFLGKTCSSRKERQYESMTPEKYVKNPVDEIIRDLNQEKNFSIILYDMDYEENTFSEDTYRHKYQLLIQPVGLDTVLVSETDWKQVPASFFNQHVNDMGMEIASKVDGKVQKKTAPAGYSHYIGNDRYGHWVERNGTSFWEFYGQFAFMNAMFNMMAYPVHRSYYDDYRRNYYPYDRPYYGSTGGTRYGTSSTMNRSRQTKTWQTKQSSFKSRVRNRVAPSSSRSTSSSRTSRSSSRYRSTSSFRSRGGGFGK